MAGNEHSTLSDYKYLKGIKDHISKLSLTGDPSCSMYIHVYVVSKATTKCLMLATWPSLEVSMLFPHFALHQWRKMRK